MRMSDLKPDYVINKRYRVIEVIGRGGMGTRTAMPIEQSWPGQRLWLPIVTHRTLSPSDSSTPRPRRSGELELAK